MSTYRQDASTGQFVRSDQQTSQNTAPSALTMHVKVHSPFQTYFDAEALSISGVNATGPFDILPRHHNFMTLLIPCELSIQTKDSTRRIIINHGVMHVKSNKVVVFLDV